MYRLSAAQKERIIEYIENLQDLKGNFLRITGSADYLGNPISNQRLSDQRVQTVSQFIRSNYPGAGFQIRDKSFGEIPFAGEITKAGNPEDRTVKIFIEKDKVSENLEEIDQLVPGSSIRLNHLNFYGGRHILLPESIPILKEIEEKLKSYPEVRIEIRGHVCCMGDMPQNDGLDLDTKEYKLSLNRAKNIYEYLVRQGIDSSRLEYRGFGYTMPLYSPEKTKEQETQNRRVELKILEK